MLKPWTCRYYHAGRGAQPTPVLLESTGKRATVTSLTTGRTFCVDPANLTPAPAVQRRMRRAYRKAVANPALERPSWYGRCGALTAEVAS